MLQDEVDPRTELYVQLARSMLKIWLIVYAKKEIRAYSKLL